MARGLGTGWGTPPTWARIALIVALVFVVAGGVYSVTRETQDPLSREELDRIAAADASAAAAEQAAEEAITDVVVLGDSYTLGAGANADSALGGYAYLLCADMGWRCQVMGIGGSGYVTDGPSGPGSSFLGDRVERVVAAQPDILIIQGSTNDNPAAPVQTAAGDLFQQVRAALPDTQIIAVGPVDPPVHGTSRVRAVRDQVQAAAVAHGVTFIDPLAENWLPETDPALYALDGHHPSGQGHRAFADRLKADLEALGIGATPSA